MRHRALAGLCVLFIGLIAGPSPLTAQTTFRPVLQPRATPIRRLPVSPTGVVIHTAPLTLVGGNTVTYGPFAPVTITTSSLTLVGGTAVQFAPFQPVTVKTSSLNLVGP
jgi:hypothetical protein